MAGRWLPGITQVGGRNPALPEQAGRQVAQGMVALQEPRNPENRQENETQRMRGADQ